MARAENDRAHRRIDAVIDEEARRLLSVEPSDGFDARVMSSIAGLKQAAPWWSVPRLAFAGAAMALALAAVLSVPWWIEGPQVPTTARVASQPTPGAGETGPIPVAPGPTSTLAARVAEDAVRRTVQPRRGLMADDAAEEMIAQGPPALEVASMGHPESLQVPSLQVAEMSIEAVQVPSVLDRERRAPESESDKEQR
jgi:hypothetical protein